jgi:Fe-S-cluster-containing hydrogenase component 2
MGLESYGEKRLSDEILQAHQMNHSSLPVVVKLEKACKHCPADKRSCENACKYDAFIYTRSQGLKLHDDKCLNCGECINRCDLGALNDKIEFIPLLNWLKDKEIAVYAAVAPAIAGQFVLILLKSLIRWVFQRLKKFSRIMI